MKITHLPKTLSDCIAVIIDLANTNEELKNRIKSLEQLNELRAEHAQSSLKKLEAMQANLLKK